MGADPKKYIGEQSMNDPTYRVDSEYVFLPSRPTLPPSIFPSLHLLPFSPRPLLIKESAKMSRPEKICERIEPFSSHRNFSI